MIFQKVPLTPMALLIFPIMAVLYVLCFGLGMVLMHYGVLLNDLENLTRILLKMIFYLSGVFYNIRIRLDGTLQYVLLRANPAAFCMDELRKVTIEGKLPSFEGILFWLAIGLALCFIGIKIIHKNENSYAKVI